MSGNLRASARARACSAGPMSRCAAVMPKRRALSWGCVYMALRLDSRGFFLLFPSSPGQLPPAASSIPPSIATGCRPLFAEPRPPVPCGAPATGPGWSASALLVSFVVDVRRRRGGRREPGPRQAHRGSARDRRPRREPRACHWVLATVWRGKGRVGQLKLGHELYTVHSAAGAARRGLRAAARLWGAQPGPQFARSLTCGRWMMRLAEARDGHAAGVRASRDRRLHGAAVGQRGGAVGGRRARSAARTGRRGTHPRPRCDARSTRPRHCAGTRAG